MLSSVCTQIDYTVKPVLSGHPWGISAVVMVRLIKGVRLIQVSIDNVILSNAIQMKSGNVQNTPRDYDDIRLH